MQLAGEITMKVNVLGPLEVSMHGRSIAPSASKPRQLLTLLAMNAGQLVTVPTLLEELWGTDTPSSAVSTLQTYIMGLRRRIGAALPAGAADDAKAVLATRPCGYLLNIPPDDIDVHRYQKLAAAGEQALAAGDHESASRLLGRALSTWRGSALVDVHAGPLLAIEVSRLEQSRLGVLESRIDADLRLGRHHELLSELADLTTRYPMHEKLCTQYMTALSVCGMKWRALEVFWVLRKTLVRELGVEPSLVVQRMQRAILRSDTAFDDEPANRRAVVV